MSRAIILDCTTTNPRADEPQNLSEPGEDEFQVLVAGDGIQLADEQDILRWFDISVGKISDHLQYGRLGFGFLFLALLLHDLGWELVLQRLVIADPRALWLQRRDGYVSVGVRERERE